MGDTKKTENGFTISKGDGFVGIFGKDIPTPVGRIAFVNLLTPTGKPTPKYGLALLVDKKDEKQIPELKAMQEMGKLMAIDLWGDKAPDMLKKVKRPYFGNGDEPSSTGKVYEGYEGKWVINARNANGFEHSRGFKVSKGTLPEQYQSGMLCRLLVVPYLNSDGFSYQLRLVKLVADDGVRFGGAPDPTNMLDHLDDAVAATVNANAGADVTDLI